MQGVRCVVHYQIPATVDVYVHRSGRTARANEDGLSIALVTPRESARYNALQQVRPNQDCLLVPSLGTRASTPRDSASCNALKEVQSQ
jgi:superfamily II DNA/RNA helicase